MSNDMLVCNMLKCKNKLITLQANTWGVTPKVGDNFILSYYNQLLSKYHSIECLLKSNCIDSIPIVARSYLENYAILQNLIIKFNRKEEYQKFIDVLTRAQIHQDMVIVAKNDPDNFISYLKACYKYIIDKPLDIEGMSDFEVMNTAKRIKKEYEAFKKSKDYKGIKLTVTEALDKNDFLRDDTKFIYPYLCNFSHANFAAIVNRSFDQQGELSINCNKEDLNYIIDVVIKSFEDIVAKMLVCLNPE